MTPKQYYSTYQADDKLSDLSRELLQQVLACDPTHVLDFGCGTGKHLAPLAAVDICTIGVDISPMNVYKAIHKYDLPCIICSDETYLRNICNVDVVMTCSVLDHVEDIDTIIDEFKRIANKAVILAETNDVPLVGGQYYYPHDYEAMGFIKLPFEWQSPEDAALYNLYKWEKK